MTSPASRAAAENLWARAGTLCRAGVAQGEIIPFPHRTETLEAAGIVWVLRVLTGSAPHPASDPDPFLPPYDPHQYVADLGPEHALLLNKYPVLDAHLLVVTRKALPQAVLPDPSDFAAAARLMDDLSVLAFYNGGPESGASQPHRHFQAVRLPLGPAPEPVPTEGWIRRNVAGSALPFPGAASALDPAWWNANDLGARLHAAAIKLLNRCGRDPASPGSFNLLFTREWMLAVPRSVRQFRGVSVNALGYAGALIAKSDEGLHTMRELGPLAVLIAATA